jgi:hypothetical protein
MARDDHVVLNELSTLLPDMKEARVCARLAFD